MRSSYRHLFARFFAFLLVVGSMSAGFASAPAQADSWSEPGTETYEAANGLFRVTVEPSPVNSSLSYFTEESDALEEGRTVERPSPIGLLERKGEGGAWEPVWGAPLVNTIAPVQALVSNDGRYVVTFDNWHSVGHGENVVVIYGPDGALIRSLKLTDLIPQMYKDSLPHTVSSLEWRRANGILPGGETLFVDVLVPTIDPYDENTDTVRFTINLADGAVSLPAQAQWSAAIDKASGATLARINEHLELLDLMRNPLVPPEGCDRNVWRFYIEEAYQRLQSPGSVPDYPSSYVLAPRHAEGFRHSFLNFKGWITLDQFEDNTMAVAAPCAPGVLEAAIQDVARDAKAGELSSVTLYVAAPKDAADRVKEMLAPSGARIIWIDPDTPLAQRADRNPGSDEETAALEAEQRRLNGETSDLLGALEDLDSLEPAD